jgi:hypothetical protein
VLRRPLRARKDRAGGRRHHYAHATQEASCLFVACRSLASRVLLTHIGLVQFYLPRGESRLGVGWTLCLEFAFYMTRPTAEPPWLGNSGSRRTGKPSRTSISGKRPL